LLRTYQLWLDDLYPRAKFADGLAIIEKLGHSKRMQVMRKAWIDEGKPKASVDEDDAERNSLPLTSDPGTSKNIAHTTRTNGSPSASEAPEIELSSLPRTGSERSSDRSSLNEIGGAPDEDELDALLAEDSLPDLTRRGNLLEGQSSAGLPPPEHSFEDDEEAMREMDELW
jgi:replication fork protection complex subunit Csm3/Swi3